MDSRDVLIAIVLAVFTGGVGAAVVTAIATRRKSRAEGGKTDSESTNIMVSTAQLLVGLSREEVERLDQRYDRLEEQLRTTEFELGGRIDELELERDHLREELREERVAKTRLESQNQELSDRVSELELELARLRDNGGINGGGV